MNIGVQLRTYELIKTFFSVELGTSNGGGTVNGRADVRDIFELPSQNDYDEEDQYNRVNTTGLFAAGGFGQRIFFRQNTAILSQMEAIGDSADNKGGFLQKGRKLKSNCNYYLVSKATSLNL